MQIIGAGFGRTGTMSLSVALEQLGYKPCYHMLEVLKHPSHIKHWQAAVSNPQFDWPTFLGNYPAGLDYPVSAFYQELMAAFRDAKVLLTVRDSDRWYESTRETIYQGAALPEWLLRLLPPYRAFARMVDETVWQRLFNGRFEERQYAIQVFEKHIEDVQRLVPPERLLVYNVREGWGPLCAFLGLPVPDKPFPHINDRAATKRLYLAARIGAILLPLAVLALLVYVLFR